MWQRPQTDCLPPAYSRFWASRTPSSRHCTTVAGVAACGALGATGACSRTPRDFRPSRWRARLRQPGQSETARRVEVVLQKFLDAFWLGAMVDKLPRKALVKFQRVTLRTMLRIVNGQDIVPLCIHLVTVGTCQGFAGNLFYALGVEVELMVQFDGAGIAWRRLVTQLDPR